MKNGKLILATLLCSTVYIMTRKSKKKMKSIPTKQQFLNRLDEFCLNDLEYAKKEFIEFLELGMNPSDAFELTIVKRVFI